MNPLILLDLRFGGDNPPLGTIKINRLEANILNENLLGTQPLTCVAATAQLVGQNCVKDFLGYGAELVAAYGPFSVQAEYLGTHYDRNPALLTFFNSFGNHAPGGT